MTTISFGTSGWRAIMNQDFTFANAKICAQAIADYLQQQKVADQGIVIGYDSRFMGEDFAAECAKVMAANQITAFLCQRETPTPVIAWEIIDKKRGGGINITASHNPPSYNGIKFSPDWGGPALPETTSWIAQRANELMQSGNYQEINLEEAKKSGLIIDCNPRPAYLDDLRKKIDFTAISKARLKIAIDPMYGTSRDYLDTILKDHTAELHTLHNWRDPYFGGRPPEPSKENIPELIQLVIEKKYHLGLATDGDADRFGIVDAGGEFIDANIFLALTADYLLSERKWEGGLARSVATTHLLDRVAAYHQRKMFETAVGFKYIGELISQNAIVLGGEESAGLSIKSHIPEKDGILACLLAAEMVAKRGKSLADQRQELFAKIGPLYTRRVNIRLTEKISRDIREKLETPLTSIGKLQVLETVTIDGTKYLFPDDCWLLIRLSGTEPVARLYAEAPSIPQLEELVQAGTNYFFSE